MRPFPTFTVRIFAVRIFAVPVFTFSASAVSLLALAGCEGNVVKDLAQSAGIGGEPRPAPDFVTRTRAGGYDYQPVGESAPKRHLKAKDKEGVASAETSLDGVRSHNEARGAAARAVGSAVVPAKPATPVN